MPRLKSTSLIRPQPWVALAVAALVIAGRLAPEAGACGGFFCQQIPINQAGEQIIFHKDGDQTTAVVLIQYVGEAPDFSWVVPVPGEPELSTGSDVLFQSFELATRPQFTLEVEGEPCFDLQTVPFLGGVATLADSSPEDSNDGVEILQSSVVGPFETLTISSEDPDALARWLEDNDYDIGERGAELIAPYVEEGMNFVALKLQKDRGVGDIRPLIMRYQSRNAVIPIRLTAVAAQQDMGVLVWILGPGRAVPLNYLHVIPNYTLLNWYSGPFTAYASYQGLITAAMDEAGGQGFATDYAGSLEGILEQLPDPEQFRVAFDDLLTADTTEEFYRSVLFGGVFPNAKVVEILRRWLPLPPGVEEFVYQDPSLLIAAVGEQPATDAQESIANELLTGVIDPLENSLAIFDGDPYLTRLYTTLSADEMTLDPEFSFNKDMAGQSLERLALLRASCNPMSGSSWSLTLVSGTDRDGETVLEGQGIQPFFPPDVDQPNIARAEMLSEDRAPQVQIDNSARLGVETIPGDGGGLCGAGAGCGSGTSALLLVGLAGLRLRRGRRGR